MTLAAVVVTYNRLAQLQVTVARLLAETVDVIVVVDNASTDGTAGWLAAQGDPRLDVVTLGQNTGGAGGFEAGMARVRDTHDADWCVLMDDDARPEPGMLARFSNAAPQGGVVAAAVFYPNGLLCEMNRPSRNPFWQFGLFFKTLIRGSRAGFHLADAAFAPEAPPTPIDIASFVGYFVHRSVMTRTGLPEGGLFIYGDDVLYSLRVRRAGLPMVMMPAIRFEHDCGTMGQGFIYRPLWKIYYHCRNGVSIARQAAGPVIFPAALLWYVTLWARRGRHYEGHERRMYRRMMWLGLRHGVMRRRGRYDPAHEMAATLAEPDKTS